MNTTNDNEINDNNNKVILITLLTNDQSNNYNNIIIIIINNLYNDLFSYQPISEDGKVKNKLNDILALLLYGMNEDNVHLVWGRNDNDTTTNTYCNCE